MNTRTAFMTVASGCAAIFFSAVLFSTASSEVAAEDKKAKGPGAELHGYRFQFPCKEKMPENPKKGAGCSSALVKGDPNKTDNFKTTATV